MNFGEYLEQFDFIQPMVFVCQRCGEEYMIVKGSVGAQNLKLPVLCAYCGAEAALGGISKDKVN